ncbi:hypothetical protein ABGB17_20340 [Sphaerisporangium sp. B11E5]|uniref:hypothetical protein n=1 Tax=Sphaerisporangium sp. B11E5 TaxID=3153563 RepID=UPI00325D2C3C
MVSLIRDREPEPDEPPGTWLLDWIMLGDLYERCYHFDPDKSYELQRRNQRQAMRRALGRLYKHGYVEALALAWLNIRDGEVMEWQGGGRRVGPYNDKTPNWRAVSLSTIGLEAALLLEGEG